MTDKPVRTTVYIPEKLHKEIKKRNINISEWLRENIEYELYQDEPEYIKRKIQELEDNYSHNKNLLLAKLKTAEKNQKEKNEKLKQFSTEPEIIQYGSMENYTGGKK